MKKLIILLLLCINFSTAKSCLEWSNIALKKIGKCDYPTKEEKYDLNKYITFDCENGIVKIYVSLFELDNIYFMIYEKNMRKEFHFYNGFNTEDGYIPPSCVIGILDEFDINEDIDERESNLKPITIYKKFKKNNLYIKEKEETEKETSQYIFT